MPKCTDLYKFKTRINFPLLRSRLELQYPSSPNPSPIFFTSFPAIDFEFRAMNRKVRVSSKSCSNRKEQFYKYLKPGALARMRDSRISAMWYQFHSLSQTYLRRTSQSESSPVSTSGESQIDMVDDFPCFAPKVYGPVSLNRKKLAAIKSTWFPSPNSQTETPDLTQDLIVDVSSSDVTAH